ncbi:lysophospholipid acyltransferase family protein [Paenibacillus sinopodophylli]|uniref:lysophospholipid acyltransferase family protein n=1 Tax=Paenibacillus sinopodophylli TaxID=1837342 RepID=UPI00110CB892|nr:lysophospholipid acyltransferase family protein [Paenibacillus sinopodophylli]
MIEANKSSSFDRIFRKYNELHLLRKHFHYVGFKGELDPYPQESVLYVMNHSSWWDGLLVYQLFRSLSKGDHYVMMDEQQLQHFRFFRKLGAYSIDKRTPQSMIPSLRYTGKLLEAGKRVWMFPQGDIHHLEQRPLLLKDGAAHVLRQQPNTTVIPVTVYYSLFHHQKADATMQAGKPIQLAWDQIGKREITERLRACLESQLDEHRAGIISGCEMDTLGYERIVKPGGSTSAAFTAFKRRMTAWKSFFGR